MTERASCQPRCKLTLGHTGKCWAEPKPKPPRLAHGSVPMHGTIEDVRALQDAVRTLAVELVLDGVKLR